MQKQKNKAQKSRAPKSKQRKTSPQPSTSSWSSAPVARTRASKFSDPRITNGADRCIIRHSEFISDVTGSYEFTVNSWSINPGLSSMFPWLSSIATRYERYQFRRLSFRYEPKCSTATPGTVILAIDYDPMDDAPSTKQDVLSYHGRGDSAPWVACHTDLSPFIGNNRGSLYTRAGTISGNYDIKTYDLGKLYVCTAANGGTPSLGEIFVDYELELLIAQVQDNIVASSMGSTSGLSRINLFGTGFTVYNNVIRSLLDVSYVPVGAQGTITFNQNFEGFLDFQISGTSLNTTINWFSVLGSSQTQVSTLTDFGAMVINGAGTAIRGCIKVRALKGQSIGPEMDSSTTPTVLSSNWLALPASLSS